MKYTLLWTSTLLLLVSGCIIFRGKTLDDGVVAHWTFNGNTVDASPYHNNGIPHGVTWTENRNGIPLSACRFGNGKWIEVPHSESFKTITSNITLAAWVKVEGYTGGWAPILCKPDKDDGQYLAFHIFNYPPESRQEYFISIPGNTKGMTDINTSARLPNEKEWHHIAVTYDGAVVRGYLDGQSCGERFCSTPLPQNEFPITIGMDAPGNVEYFRGDIDDLIVYNRTLSAEEVIKLFSR